MPRKRASRLPTALMKAFLPSPPTRRRRRRRAATISLPTVISPPKAVAKRKPARVAKSSAGRPKSGTRKTGSRPGGRGTWHLLRFSAAVGTRAYRVYVPFGLRRTTRAPMLLALHGCTQDAMDFAAGTRFNELADRHQFVVVYPEQSVAHNGQRCWNWFRTGHQFREQGEPAILAGIVGRMLAERARWRIDPERVYVTGISAGGAMAVVLSATYPELFAAVGVHSAPPYRSAAGPANAIAAMQGRVAPPPVHTASGQAMPPMIIFQGTFDGTVRPVNARRVADQWLAARATDAGPRTQSGLVARPIGAPRVATAGPARPVSTRSRRGHTVSRWYSGGRKVLELWEIDGLGHAWSGGSTNGSYSDARGPRASSEMWKFFAAHRAVEAATQARAG